MKKQIDDAFSRENLKEVILICSCFRQEKRASEAFSVLFPNKILPPIVKGRDRIYKLAKKLNNNHIEAISKISGKYAYYIKLDNGIIKELN